MNLLVQLVLFGILLPNRIGFGVNAFSMKPTGRELLETKSVYSPSFYQEKRTTSGSVLPQQCPGENYSPCTCVYQFLIGNRIKCEHVPLEKVKSVMNASGTMELFVVDIYTTESEIPDDLLGGKKTLGLAFLGQGQVLKFTSKSLRSTYEYSMSFQLFWCYVNDFGFLDGFKQIESLAFFYTSEAIFQALASIPLLPSVTDFHITGTTTSKALNGPCPNVAVALSEVYFTEDLLDDASMSLLLKCILGTSSKTVTELYIWSNKLTTVPQEVTSFEHLIRLGVENNNMSRIRAGSLNFSFSSRVSCLKQLEMQNSGIEEIEPGAFGGYFGCAKINLNGNRLTRFESSVFLEVAQQISETARNGGYIDIENNPIDCEMDLCHLEWLIVNNSRMVDKIVINGRCSNRTHFADLNAKAMEAYCRTPVSSTTIATHLTSVLENMNQTTVAESITSQSTLVSMKTDTSTTLPANHSTMPTKPGTSDLTPSTLGETGVTFSSPLLGSSANTIMKKKSNIIAQWGPFIISTWISLLFTYRY